MAALDYLDGGGTLAASVTPEGGRLSANGCGDTDRAGAKRQRVSRYAADITVTLLDLDAAIERARRGR